MARLVVLVDRPVVRILDPGAGFGILGLSVAIEILQADMFGKVHLVAVEAEPNAQVGLRAIYASAMRVVGSRLHAEVVDRDFLDTKPGDFEPFDIAISNPPYFKMSPKVVKGGNAPNSYARFMEVALGLLRPGGDLCFIIPRSFASGHYFKGFRQRLHEQASLEYVHVFESRREVFSDQEVLQENVIVTYRKGPSTSANVLISAGTGVLDAAKPMKVPRGEVLRKKDNDLIVWLPTCKADLDLMKVLHRWPCTLADYDLEISTGPVVPFRAEDVIHFEGGPTRVPLLWLQHVRVGEVTWPLGSDAFRKQEHIDANAGPLLVVPNKTYILMRRFSAKEEPRRVTCAVVRKGQFPGEVIGLENHLNFIHRPGGDLDDEEALGLCALLNSTRIDQFFRISSGNTQVSATEMRALPLPELQRAREIGRLVAGGTSADVAVARVLDEPDRGSEGDSPGARDAAGPAERQRGVHAGRVREHRT